MGQSATSRGQHDVEIVDSFSDPRPFAECSCGWSGPRHRGAASLARALAVADAERHLDEIRSGEAGDA